MNSKLERLVPYYGHDKLERIKTKSVLVLGLGGVGGLVCESLIRSGITNIGILDGDKVEVSNFNRQIIALESTIGMPKVEAMKKRLLDIEKTASIKCYNFFVDDQTIHNVDFENYDLVLDCIDDVKAKVLIIENCKNKNVSFISSMGTGNKTDPNGFKIADINQTSYCPLAKKIRLELRKKEIRDVKVCYSTEIPLKNDDRIIASPIFVVGSASFVIVKEALNILSLTK